MAFDYRREALSSFLRSRRERLTPESAQLRPRGARRRTPGLRREEVAALAGVGLTWYTWLEQGRVVHASPQVLRSIAGALQLSEEETNYLLVLASQPPAISRLPQEMLAAVQRILDQQGPNPACLQGPRLDILAANRAMQRVIWDAEMPAGAAETRVGSNTLRSMFTLPGPRRIFLNWEAHAQRTLALFRSNWARYPDDPSFRELFEEMMGVSAEFRAWWPRQEVGRMPVARIELDHPRAGRLVLERTALELVDFPSFTIVFNMPLAEADTAAKLARLCSAPDVGED